MSKGIQLFEQENFKGNFRVLAEGEHSLCSSIIGKEGINSIKVAQGYYARVYMKEDFRGGSIPLFDGNYHALPSWRDKIFFIEVFKPMVPCA